MACACVKAKISDETIEQLRVPRKFRRILAFMRDHGPCTVDEIVDHLYGDDPEGGPITAREGVCVRISTGKPELRKFGYVIDHVSRPVVYCLRRADEPADYSGCLDCVIALHRASQIGVVLHAIRSSGQRGITYAALEALLWPEERPINARKALHVAVLRARKALRNTGFRVIARTDDLGLCPMQLTLVEETTEKTRCPSCRPSRSTGCDQSRLGRLSAVATVA